MSDTDTITVEIEKDAPVAETPVTENAPDPIVELKAQYDALEAERELEKTARAEAERRAAEAEAARLAAERETESTRSEIVDARMGTVESALSAAQNEAEAAKAAYAAAMEAGDWKRAADEQQKLARAEARVVRLDEAKSDLEVAKTAPKQQPVRPEPVSRPAAADPVESFISGPIDAQGRVRAPEAQAWLRAHKDYITDERKLKKLGAADMDAQAEGIAVNTPEYFAHVEKFLGLTKDAKPTNGATNGTTNGRSNRSPPVAPVATGAGATSTGGEVVHLSKTEASAATDGTLVWNYDDPTGKKRFKKGDPIGTQEMARRKLAMQKQGLYDKTYLEQ